MTRHGPLKYAGLAGIEAVLKRIRVSNDMGHALFRNIRSGHWLMDYTLERLAGVVELGGVLSWLQRSFLIIKGFPAGLRPQVPRACVCPAVSSTAHFDHHHFLGAGL